MRRIPFILVKEGRLMYLCPQCKKVIPRDLYVLQNWCPSCESRLNQTAKSIMKVYKDLDKEFYKHFIDIYRGEKK